MPHRPDPNAEFVDIIRRLIHLRRRFKAVLPRDVAQARARFKKLLPEDRSGQDADFDLLHNLGVALSRRKEPMTMGELSQTLDVPLSTATRIVDLLVKNDYARRLPDPGDRRVVRIALTETGQGMYQALDDFMRRRIEQLLRPFSRAECRHLVRLLNKLVAGLEKEV